MLTLKNTFYLLIASFLFFACATEKDHLVTIQTKYGNMKVILFEETPLHKENFIKLAKEGDFDSTIFHRVIKGFMVQGGDVNNKPSGKKKIDYTIPAEIVEGFYHQKGMLAAARMGDNVNPKKESSGCQFYIVQGKVWSELELAQMEANQNQHRLQAKLSELLKKPAYAGLRNEIIELQRNGEFEAIQTKVLEAKSSIEKEFGPLKEFKLTDEQKEIYSKAGGSPHLDGEYTLFGKVVEGLDVVDSIANTKTKPGDKPVEDIYMKVLVEKVNKKKISKLYGYEYPAEQ